ncbi:unnamed protein product [Ceratitis capitata]|uniref:(Mediterranean fruit fly) hypothetical protein n=1 Tax=Ceratitis capitata TaxID=7213 RepID=A0A811VGW0_CERCA|nr:unnamed protein product [Ceratitis capitata]
MLMHIFLARYYGTTLWSILNQERAARFDCEHSNHTQTCQLINISLVPTYHKRVTLKGEQQLYKCEQNSHKLNANETRHDDKCD